ncbi:MAG: 3-dehydroquinate synthase [Candidatus Omnitrophica bacterium]|nr:3-dehydroquinate synthase [Candidatus Omnitrophota bacterium]
MKKITVRCGRGRYSILIGKYLLDRMGSLLRLQGFSGKVMIVTQGPVAKFHLGAAQKSLRKGKYRFCVHEIMNGEEGKSGREFFRLSHALVENDFERRDLILALGGGVVGDLAGFAAASYLRGIRFVNAGTTLLAQVDSSIGGKTGINLPQGKNLVGAFYPPSLVVSDISVLATLSDREYHSSLGEVVKYGMIRDKALFSLLAKEPERVMRRDPVILEKMVMASSRIKADVVSRDEYETKGERMILNFGHTFGHAFEQALDYRKLMHGEAVAAGMVAASEMAVTLRLFSPTERDRLVSLLGNFHLPTSLSGFGLSLPRVMNAMMRDKKKKAGKLRFVLPVKIGKVVVQENIPKDILKKTIQKIIRG